MMGGIHDEILQRRPVVGELQFPGGAPVIVGADTGEPEARVMIFDQRVFRGRDEVSPDDGNSRIAGHLAQMIEQKLLDARRQQLFAERAKLLQAHYADAIPLDLLKTEQTRIAAQLKGPGGLTMRELHEQVQKSVARDREAQTTRNPLAQKPSRWQRAFSFLLRYVQDRKRR